MELCASKNGLGCFWDSFEHKEMSLDVLIINFRLSTPRQTLHKDFVGKGAVQYFHGGSPASRSELQIKYQLKPIHDGDEKYAFLQPSAGKVHQHDDAHGMQNDLLTRMLHNCITC
ncbi:hypothetical protein D5086_030975 [Populus alba]|uniref:Uncharacterized protein n=1 Tax=Populus alba TaxID=43335 RepID=A0ACC4AQN6_POPAL